MEFEKIQAIIADVLSIDASEITMESTFIDDLGADSLDVYQIIMEDVGGTIAEQLMESGSLALNQNDYTAAIDYLEKARHFDQGDSRILYQLAQAYRLAEETEKAKETYEQVITLFPDSEDAEKAQEY